MKKFFAVLFAISALSLLLFLVNHSSSTAKAPAMNFVEFNSMGLPEALDMYQAKADQVVLLVDATKGQVLKDVPTIAYVGNTVTVSSKEHPFVVMPTRLGTAQVIEVKNPGDVVEVKEDGQYTIVILKVENQEAQAIAVTYVLKATEKNFDKLLKEVKRRIQEQQETDSTQKV